MGRINAGKVVVGGLVAGLVINISEFVLNTFVVAADMEVALKAMNKTMPGNHAIGVFVLVSFLLGILSVWLYAAMRPRFGPGPGTAVKAALAVWGLGYLYPNVFMVTMDIFPLGVTSLSLVWGLGEIMIGTMAGAWLYSE